RAASCVTMYTSGRGVAPREKAGGGDGLPHPRGSDPPPARPATPEDVRHMTDQPATAPTASATPAADPLDRFTALIAELPTLPTPALSAQHQPLAAEWAGLTREVFRGAGTPHPSTVSLFLTASSLIATLQALVDRLHDEPLSRKRVISLIGAMSDA